MTLTHSRRLIRGGTLVLRDRLETADLLIEAGRILDIAPATAAVDEVIDATGLYVLPGVIDAHVHFREPGVTHKEDLHTGSRACAKGGVTSFLEMPNTKPVTTTVERLHEKLAIAGAKSLVNFGFYIGATPHNLEELKAAKRTPGIKIFIGSSTGDLLVDDQASLEAIFRDTTLPICAHCEDETTVRANTAALGGGSTYADHSRIRDARAAMICTQRAIDLATRHNHRFHILHMSTGAEAELLATPRPFLTGEVCPHHLFFNVDDYARLGSLVQMNPSIKTAADNRELWDGLVDGRIQVIATDHAPHTWEEKQKPYPASPSGLPAVENSLTLILNQVNLGRCTLLQVAEWMCRAPAAVWDIVNKGEIRPGFDADLVLVDMDRKHTIRNEEQETKARWSPWHGETPQGLPVETLVNGHTVFRRGVFDESQRGTEIEFDHSRGGYWAHRQLNPAD